MVLRLFLSRSSSKSSCMAPTVTVWWTQRRTQFGCEKPSPVKHDSATVVSYLSFRRALFEKLTDCSRQLIDTWKETVILVHQVSGSVFVQVYMIASEEEHRSDFFLPALPILTVNDLQLLHTVHRAYQRHQWVLPKRRLQSSLLIGQNGVGLVQEKLNCCSHINLLQTQVMHVYYLRRSSCTRIKDVCRPTLQLVQVQRSERQP